MRKALSEQLDENELNLLAGALPRIAILIGGADGDFDENERTWADKLVHIRSFSNPVGLEELYDRATKQFSDHMEQLFQSYPNSPEDRNQQISTELASINGLLRKLDPASAYLVYKSFRSFAWHIARTSGGFLGFGSIGNAEEKWVSLPMLEIYESTETEEEE